MKVLTSQGHEIRVVENSTPGPDDLITRQWCEANAAYGKSAYDLAVQQGYSWNLASWLVSLKGETGTQGATGVAGVQGSQGITGAAGVQGSQGATGPAGIQGVMGATGSAGVQGSQGVTGQAGAQGSTGATGVPGVTGSPGVTGAAGVSSFATGGNIGSAATPATTGTMTVSMTTAVITITPTGNCTFNASGGVTGQIVTFAITTNGTSSFTMTWGTNFRKTGTLATGTTSARFFSVDFRCINGTIWQEMSRTAAQT